MNLGPKITAPFEILISMKKTYFGFKKGSEYSRKM